MPPSGQVDKEVDGRRLRYAGRRDDLLNAITNYVIENGVSGLSMRPLAKDIGVSHASLLHHFGTKENLLAEVIENMRRETIPPALISGTADDPVALLTQWWTERTAEPVLRRYRVMLEIYVQAVLEPDRYDRFLDQFVGQWVAALENGLRRAGCPDAHVTPEATLILAQVRGLCLDLLGTGDRDRVDAAFALLRDWLAARIEQWRGARG
ncbi:TetR/AcrR family transcriptional regulator [Rhodococcus sp. ACT016]|uniref:TetR/AcrR family transcriptional regulator n=1 Tax=Rhodococcus sp. ACT016 TaxID=3134808 RepID=UPI003D281979